MSHDLKTLQGAMAEKILDPTATIPLDWFEALDGTDLGVRLDVYAEGYLVRVADSLVESFPALANILGASEMAMLTERYIAQLKDPSRNLNYIGRDLPNYLPRDSHSKSLPFLPDLARLEWAIAACFHEDHSECLDLERCSHWDALRWGRARMTFQPGTCVIRSQWPLLALRETRHQERNSIDLDLDLGGDECVVMISRLQFEVMVEAVDQQEAQAFERLNAGETLGAVMAAFAKSGRSAETVTELFARWSSKGLIRRCS